VKVVPRMVRKLFGVVDYLGMGKFIPRMKSWFKRLGMHVSTRGLMNEID